MAWTPLAAQGASKRERAAAAYDNAVQMRTAFEAQHPESRSLKDYLRLIRAFDLVYRIDPGYSKTPRAISDEAEVYCEMGRTFASDRYYESAVAAYQFLVDQYPTASASRDAVFAIAEIYRVDLENPEEAAKSYQEFLTKYPQADQAPEAKLRLREVNRRLSAEAAERAHAAEGSNPSSASASGTSGRTVAVNDVRFWEGSDYTRIVVSLEDEAKFESVRLSHPDRIVFDLPGTHLSRSLAGKSFPVGNGFLQQIRVAQFKPDVTRVVLDVAKIGDYSVFSLPNPFRVIIDVRGPQQLVARSTAPAAGARGAAAKPSSAVASTSSASSAGAAPKGSLAAATGPQPDESASTRVKPAPLADSNVKEYDLSAPVASAPPASSASGGGNQAGDVMAKSASRQTRPATASAQPSAQTSSGSATLTRALGLKIARIVIDPGHGGHDTGTIGPKGLEEKEVVLDVALRLRKLVEQRMGSDVVMTRSDDTFIPLEERTAIANQRSADLFISIHANASHDPSARGIEVYYLNFTSDPNSLETAARENATSQESVYQLQDLIKKIALTEKIQESSEFARQVDHSLESAETRGGTSPPDRGLKKAPFVVLIGANMPSILCEISFLTNPRDERLLRQPQYRQQIAEGLYRGVARYVATLGSMKIAQRADTDPPARPLGSRSADAGSPSSSSDSPDF